MNYNNWKNYSYSYNGIDIEKNNFDFENFKNKKSFVEKFWDYLEKNVKPKLWDEDFKEFYKNLWNVFWAALKKNENGTFSMDLSQNWLDKIKKYTLNWLDKFIKNKSNKESLSFNWSYPKNFEEFDRLLLWLSKDLKENLEKQNFPSKVENNSIPQSIEANAKKLLMPIVFWFMTYGWHGQIDSKINSMMNDNKLQWIDWSLPELLAWSGAFYDVTTWWTAWVIAWAISYAIVKVGSKSYKNLKKYQEEEKEKWNNPKIRFKDYFLKKKNLLNSALLASSMVFAWYEWLWMLNKEVQQVYARDVANSIRTQSSEKISDVRKETSEKYNNIIASIANSDKTRVELEWWRWGLWPVWYAKNYLVEWRSAIAKIENQSVKNMVIKADNEVKNFYIQNWYNPEDFKNFNDFLAFASEKQDNILAEINNLIEKDYSDLENREKLYHYDFHQKQEELEKKLEEKQEELSKLREHSLELQKIYENFVDEIEQKWNKMYNWNVEKTELPNLPEIDLKEYLEDIMNENPELEGKTSMEYIKEFYDLFQKWTISWGEFVWTWSWIVFRSLFLEWLAIYLLMKTSLHRLNYSRKDEYSEKWQKEYIDNIYNKMLDWIEETFSWEKWSKAIPGFSWLTREEADIVLKRFLLEKDKNLYEHFFVEENSKNSFWNEKNLLSWKNLKKFWDWVKKTFSWDIRTENEKFLEKMFGVFEEMSNLAASQEDNNTNIDKKDILNIIKQIVPENWNQNKLLLDDIYSEILLEKIENSWNISLKREDVYSILRENYDIYMANNIIDRSKIFLKSDIEKSMKKFYENDFVEEILKNFEDEGIFYYDFNKKFQEKIEYHIDPEKVWKFEEYLNENYLSKDISLNEILYSIEKSTWNKQIFMDNIKNLDKEKLDSMSKYIDIDAETVNKIQSKLNEKFSDYNFKTRDKFLEKMEVKDLILLKILSMFLWRNFENPKKYSREEFIEFWENLFYDKNLTQEQTFKNTILNIEEIRRVLELSKTKKFLNEKEEEGNLKSEKSENTSEKKKENSKNEKSENNSEKGKENSKNEKTENNSEKEEENKNNNWKLQKTLKEKDKKIFEKIKNILNYKIF